jgi:aromatic-L-amino-acid decarboxylase
MTNPTLQSLIQELHQLEKEAAPLEPEPGTRAQWDQTIQQYAHDFIDQLPDKKSFHRRADQTNWIQELPVPETGRDLSYLLKQLAQYVDSTGINPASGGHLGYIPGGGIYPAALGDYLAAVTNRYAGIFFANPGAVQIENQLIRWMCELVGFPDTALGNLASGGSIANLIAITTARDAKGIRAKEIDRAVIYLTPQVHHCVQKALRIAGLGESIIRYIPLDDRFRMRADLLENQVTKDRKAGLRPFLVVGSAGTTDTGAIDPLEDLGRIAATNDMWYHVDAAYGGFFVLVDELKPAFKGIELSDSVAIDPHKGMFLAYGLGAVLIKDVKAQYDSHYYQANYMQDTFSANDEPSPADLSPELTKHFRGLRMWLAVQLLGLQPFRAALREKHVLARYFFHKIQELGFEVGPEPELSVMIYRYIPSSGDVNKFNQRLLERMHADGRIFISSTNIEGVFWFRLAVLSFRTHQREIDLLLEMFSKALKETLSEWH